MKNKILQLLASLNDQAIELLTTENIFERGFDYFLRERVKNFSWDSWDNNDRLKALVQGTSPYLVMISLVDGKDLYCVCNCPAWTQDFLCKHVICVLLIASNLLHNKKSSAPGPRSTAALLKKDLLADSSFGAERESIPAIAAKDIVKINLIPGYSYRPLLWPRFLVSLTHGDNGQYYGSPYAKLLDPSTQPMLRESILCKMIEHENLQESFIVHTQQGPLEVVSSQKCIVPLTELNIIGDFILVRCLAAATESESPSEVIRIGERLVVDVAHKHLTVICKGNMWEWPERIIERIGNAVYWGSSGISPLSEQVAFINAATDKNIFPNLSNPIPLSVQQFNSRLHLTYNAANRDRFARSFMFKQEGVVVNPEYITPSLKITGSVDLATNMIALKPHIMIGDQELSLDFFLIHYLEKIDNDLSSWLRTKARRSIIAKTIFSLLGVDEQDVEKMIKAVVKEIALGYQGNIRTVRLSEVTNYFTGFYSEFLEVEREGVIVSNQTFYKVVLNYRYLWKAYQLISTFFDGSFVQEKGMSANFQILLPIFYEKFTLFNELLERNGIDFLLNNKRVEKIKLDVSIDVGNTSSGDWFELAPHILAEGIALSDEQRDVLFASDGFIETSGCIQILDVQSRDIIKILAKMLRPGDTTQQLRGANIISQLPRLRVLDLLELRQSGAHVSLSPEDEQLVGRLANFSKIENIPLPLHFVGTLREYQKAGYQWLAFLYKNRFGACLADDMGLGKTIQAIAFLGGLAEGIIEPQCKGIKTPHLIVMPPTLLFNWMQELNHFYPSLRVTEYSKAVRANDFKGFDVVLTTYDRVRIDCDYLTDIKFHTIIFDEAQAIKNIYSGRTAAARQLKSYFTISLTGTPLENHIGEYYSILDVALPGLLPTYKMFMNAVQKNTHEDLIKKTRPFVLRRTKETILQDLPPKVESNVYLTMTDKQQKLYATTVKEVKRLIEEAYRVKTAAQANVIALTAILRLRQICISPQMIDAKKDESSPKIDYLLSNLEEIVQEGNAALVFSQFTMCLDLIENALTAANISFYRIDGKTPMAQRKKIVQSFQNNDTNVSILLLSLKTGGVGLNLTRANYVFHVDPWWNPAVENQASDRSHRIGQKNSVFITRLVMHHTIEEKMMALKEEKQKLFKDVMEHAENKTKGMISKRDFDLLLS